jgi:hypothetical protein
MGQENEIKIATLPIQDITSTDTDPVGLVNAYASELVSGLFEDVDKLLDGDEVALAQVEQLTSLIAAPPVVDGDTPPAVDQEPVSTAIVPAEKASAGDADDSITDAKAPDTGPVAPSKSKLGHLLDRFLLTTTVFSLLGILGFLVYGYQRGVRWVNPLAQPVTATGPSQSDLEFLEYLDRSLDVIAKKVERGTTDSATAMAQSPNVSVLPASPPLLPPLTPVPSRVGLMSPGPGPVNVIERVYIPYQTAQQPIPATPGTQQEPQSGADAAVLSQAMAPAAMHVLVGLLELGERSAALFEINGVPRRVYIGEPIGDSGWNLAAVSNDEARIRRNGEVRSVYIGQQF